MRVAWSGPRFGIAGIRELLEVTDRPLTCAALKPVGRSPDELAATARSFADGGVDVIKDDHGLTDQASAPFEERVRACASAVRESEQRTGRRVLYAANVPGGPDAVRRGIARARELRADAVLIQPALIGLPAFAEIAGDAAGIPLIAHPSLAGLSGIAPEAMLGRLFRLFGADAVIYPHAGGRFRWSDRTCARIAHGLRADWPPLKGSLPVPAGGIRLDRIEELIRFYGRDVMVLVGGSLYLAGDRLEQRARELVEAVRAG
jgi:ribulose-bisphosphate carboxylase large chain